MPEQLPAKSVEPKSAIDLPSWAAYLYAPILPLLKKIKIRRAGPRGCNPKDTLLPRGYAAEMVATGFNAPVHCCFDGEGFCYVSECGHKIDSRPRVFKVNVETGERELFLDLPEDRAEQRRRAVHRDERQSGAAGGYLLRRPGLRPRAVRPGARAHLLRLRVGGVDRRGARREH